MLPTTMQLHPSLQSVSCFARLPARFLSPGSEFVALPRDKQIAILKESRGCVFSRAEPKHKQVRT